MNLKLTKTAKDLLSLLYVWNIIYFFSKNLIRLLCFFFFFFLKTFKKTLSCTLWIYLYCVLWMLSFFVWAHYALISIVIFLLKNIDQYSFNQALPKVFSAGLDLVKEVYSPKDLKHLATFWQAFQGMWLRLYGSRLLTMAAIEVRVPFCLSWF